MRHSRAEGPSCSQLRNRPDTARSRQAQAVGLTLPGPRLADVMPDDTMTEHPAARGDTGAC